MTGDIAGRLAHAMGRRDEEPNIALAHELAEAKDREGISRLAEIAAIGSTAAQNDAIRILYENGACDPFLLQPHVGPFLEKIHRRNNRMVWGSLTALSEIAKIDAGTIFEAPGSIIAVADKGSVISRDQAIRILIALPAKPEFAGSAASHLFARLESAAVNQLPMYAERVHDAMNEAFHPRLHSVLSRRLMEGMAQSKRRRLERVIRRLAPPRTAP